MQILKEVYNNIADKWKNNKGIGTIYCNKPLDFAILTANIIKKMRDKNNKLTIFIVVDCYNTRKYLIEKFNELNIDHSNITCLSLSYINTGYSYNYDLIISIDLSSFKILKYLKDNSKFILNIFTNNKIPAEELSKIYSILIPINIDINETQIKNAIICSPVEEHRIGIDLDADSKAEYDKQSAYISNTMIILGDIGNIYKIKNGDSQLGLSAAEVRYKIARNNGWSDDLDTTIPFNKQIDDAYNPIILYEKACKVYEIMHNRRLLVSDYISKINIIKDIIKNNPNKKILIISKRGEFAAEITKHLINDNINCGDYHDCIEKCIAVDNDGYPILVKSGKNKGEPKLLGAQAISNINLKEFINNNDFNVLSAKNSSINGLDINCHIWIITSPLCDSIHNIKQRFTNINFYTNPNIIYKIYCNATIEENALSIEKESVLHKIIIDSEKNTIIDENSGDVIL